jgi:hypothetical protein
MSDQKVKVKIVEDTYDTYRIAGQLGATHEVSKELADKMVASKHAEIVKEK